jgi:NADH-quinone oxidoreductase subunit C
MTEPLSPSGIAKQIGEHIPDAIADSDENAVFVRSEALFDVLSLLKETLNLDYLSAITAIDYQDYFELVYYLISIKNNRSLVLKTRCEKGEKVPSVVSLWQGADLQERDIFDLMGIAFSGHPNLKRIFLWDGFKGHPLRKDWSKDGAQD